MIRSASLRAARRSTIIGTSPTTHRVPTLPMKPSLPAGIPALLLALAATACGGESEPDPAPERPTVQIAFVTGASDGTAARRGIDLALAELNDDSAGTYRYAVSTVEARDPATATQECGRLVGAEGLVAIIGSQTDEPLTACATAIRGAGLVYLSIAETSGEVCTENLFQIAPLPNQRAAAEQTAAQLSARESAPLTVSDYFESVQLPENERFVAALRQSDPAAAPAPEAARAFDAVHLVASAVRGAGGLDRAAVLAALPSVRHDGPRGPVFFPAGSNFATLNMFVGRTTSEGTIEPVSFRPAVAAEPACG